MSDLTISTVAEGQCHECNQTKHGVSFRVGARTAFLCWEHFRLLQEAMKPGRVEVRHVTEIVSCGCCHSCCCHRGRTYTRSYSVCYSQSSGICESTGAGRSRGESFGMSETRTEGRSVGETSTHSSGHSSSESP